MGMCKYNLSLFHLWYSYYLLHYLLNIWHNAEGQKEDFNILTEINLISQWREI